MKTPLEYVASALRATDADISSPTVAADWLARMGQPLYGYLELTGWPDESAYWLDAASLLQRVAFAEQLALNRIEGISIGSTINTAGAESLPAAAIAAQLLPGRALAAMLDQLEAAEPHAAPDANEGQRLAALTALVIASPEFQLR